ncbi:chemotaxis protein CheW [Candidatus Deferrimicrobium sp.]|uniref:chemotaxis protein CheW n=1 Tax=Candidatus Deferrimicrobium sp. TaxID=3060586 RepID=UPI003C63B301
MKRMDTREAILKERAVKIGRAPDRAVAAGDRLEVVEFLLMPERFAVESRYVQEICPLKEISLLPCVPLFVAGIMNVRGRIVPVVDIRRFFEFPLKGLTDLNRVIVLASGDTEFGILADAIHGIRHIFAERLQSSLPTLTGIREEYLKGVTGDGLVVLDGAKLLSDSRIFVNDEVDS